MRCDCGREAVIFRRFEGRALCRQHFIESVDRRIKKLIRKEKMIDDGDRIAVGLSGGKDSSLALYLLNNLSKESKSFKVFAILVDEGVKGYRDKTIKHAKNFCKDIGVKLHIVRFKDEYGKTLDQIVKKSKGNLKACTYCGVFRRDLLNKTARKLKATKLVIAHNLDDEVQSIMANYVRGDLLRAARVGAKAYVVKDARFIPRIKPLREIPEKETALYVLLKKFDTGFEECPYAMESFRWDIRDTVNDLENKFPGTKYSILRTFDRILPVLQKEFLNKKIGKCSKCGEPTSGEICKVCTLLKTVK